ncbi:MAG: hypothetical protein M3296_05240, partial [Actinomycetota bacterium]|nr:hypothetical protein [Actinomycetota bacterium]
MATDIRTAIGRRRLENTGRAAHVQIPAAVHATVPVVVAGLWALAIRDVDMRAMNDLGLISVLPASAFVLLCLLATSFCISLAARPLRPWVPLAHVLVLIVILYGVTAFLEAEPRFSTVWKHVGIIDHIARTRSADPGIDAYFNWPGFFALGAVISDAAGFSSPMAMGAWGPLVFNLLFLPPLLVILRWASDDPRVTWLGLWVFYSANWVGQDYFAPQAVALVLWLAMLAVLLPWFTPKRAMLASLPSLRGVVGALSIARMRARLAAETTTVQHGGTWFSRVGLVITVVAIFAAVATGHQLTPFAAIVTVTALVLFAGLEIRRLPVIMIVFVAAWISYMAVTYLTGHIQTVAGPLGSVSDNVNQNVSGRLRGSAQHEFIVHLRVLGSLAIWAIAAAGFARRLRARRSDLALVLVGAGPFLLPILQPYGGEVALRVFLFALPAVAFFIACLAFPTPEAGRGWPTVLGAVIVSCALLGLFQYMRYGNERLDHFTRGDVAAVEALYRLAPRGATLVAGTQNIPWRNRDYVEYDYVQANELESWNVPVPDPARLAAELQRKARKNDAYVIVTRSTKIAAAMLDGKPGALDGLVRLLRSSPAAAREVYRNRDGVILHLSRTGPPIPHAVRRPDLRALALRRAAAAERRRAA